MKENVSIRVAVHLSSTAIYTVAGYLTHEGRHLKIVAVGVAKTEGFFGGNITDVKALSGCIRQSVEQAMDMAGLDIYDVGLSFATEKITAHNGQSFKQLAHHSSATGQIVSRQDIVDIYNAIKQIDGRRDVFQIYSQAFSINHRKEPAERVDSPVGRLAYEVMVQVHIVGVSKSYYQDMDNVFKRSELGIYPAMFAGISGAEYALSDYEKHHGVCFVDIGAGTTSVCCYYRGVIYFNYCFLMAGQTVDSDIVEEFKWLDISIEEARYLKEHHGSAFSRTATMEAITMRNNLNNREITVTEYNLAEVIERRYDAIFKEIVDKIHEDKLSKAGLDLKNLTAGIVLAGGGSQVKDLERLLQTRFNVPVRHMSVNNCVSVCAKHVNDDNMSRINGYLADNTLYNAIGVLLHQQSKQYKQTEDFLYSKERQPKGWFNRAKTFINQTIKEWL